MAIEEKLGIAKGFGARYGRSIRERFAKIVKEKNDSNKCPYCNKDRVKRLASGIWSCRKCNAKFTGRAYTFTNKIVLREEANKEELITLKEKEDRAAASVEEDDQEVAEESPEEDEKEEA